jgi:division protein CdvB (Snf7/Vps24/ESCRT-III family)
MRKTMSTVMKSQFSIEGLINRLQTINDVAELREAISPIKGVLEDLKGQLSGILPNASRSIREVEEAVEDAIYGIGTVSDTIVEPSINDEEVRKILMEASEVAAQRLKNEKFIEDLNEAVSYR